MNFLGQAIILKLVIHIFKNSPPIHGTRSFINVHKSPLLDPNLSQPKSVRPTYLIILDLINLTI